MATSSYNINETRTIAVVGCGIGGAALALALQQKGLPVTVYGGDTSFDVRNQGYITNASCAQLTCLSGTF